MPRARRGAARRQSKNRLLKAAKGYRGTRSKNWRRIREAVTRAGVYAFRDRRARKRSYRALWITRVNAAARMRGVRYSELIAGLSEANIILNRKMLSEIAIHDTATFDLIVAKATGTLKSRKAA